MKVLALEPYHGGSHQEFLDGWTAHSRHDWTALTLPPYKWKWRMRHSAVTFAGEVRRRLAVGEAWDCIFCSDMEWFSPGGNGNLWRWSSVVE